MHAFLIILYSLLSLFLLAGIIFLAVGIYVLIQIKKHFKNVADKTGEAISHIKENPHTILGKIFAAPFVAYLARKIVRGFL